MASPTDKFRAAKGSVRTFQRGRSSIPGRRGDCDAVLHDSSDGYDSFVPRGEAGEVDEFC